MPPDDTVMPGMDPSLSPDTPSVMPGMDPSLYRRGGRARFARGGETAEDLPMPAAKPKRSVLTRKPMAMPVLHTTIVITPKPKSDSKRKPPVKKKHGGPLKAAALPPRKGPQDDKPGPPAPFRRGGHVQVPRGSGRAERGKYFRGIH